MKLNIRSYFSNDFLGFISLDQVKWSIKMLGIFGFFVTWIELAIYLSCLIIHATRAQITHFYPLK